MPTSAKGLDISNFMLKTVAGQTVFKQHDCPIQNSQHSHQLGVSALAKARQRSFRLAGHLPNCCHELLEVGEVRDIFH